MYIKLAGCVAADSVYRFVREHREEYIRRKIQGKKLFYQLVNKQSSTDTLDVLLYRKYPLELFCINADFIENGFARLGDTTGLENAKALVRAEQKARLLKNGIWGQTLATSIELKQPVNQLLLYFSPEIRTTRYDDRLYYFGLQYSRGEQSTQLY